MEAVVIVVIPLILYQGLTLRQALAKVQIVKFSPSLRNVICHPHLYLQISWDTFPFLSLHTR